MISKYLRSVYRNIKFNYGFHLVNTAGLIVGLVCAMVIFLYARQELSFDKHHDDYPRIFRVAERISSSASSREFAATPWPLRSALTIKFDQIECAARVYEHFEKMLVKAGDNSFYANNFLFAEEDILDILSFNFIAGNPQTALERPNSVVLTEKASERIFGDSESLGNTLLINGDIYEITGIIEDYPVSTHLKADYIASLESIKSEESMTNWLGTECYTYIKLRENIQRSSFDKLIKDIAYDYAEDKISSTGNKIEFFLQDISKIHLYSHMRSELEPPGNFRVLSLLCCLGLFVLLSSILNYINLSVAKITERNPKIGILKTFGANRLHIISPLYLETLLMVLVSIIAAALISSSISDYFHQYIVLEKFNVLFTNYLNLGLLILFIVILSGLIIVYPAIYVSRVQPVSAIDSKGSGHGGALFRRILIILQFAFSLILIIVTLVSNRQIRYMESYDLGYRKDCQLILRFNRGASLRRSPETIKNIFLECPGVHMATASSHIPGEKLFSWNVRSMDNSLELNNSFCHLFIDPDFFNNYGIGLLAGRNFDADLEGTDMADWSKNTSFIINESALRVLGYSSPEDALGMSLKSGLGNLEGEIIGVVKDFHYEGLQNSVAPLILEWFPARFKCLTLHIDNNAMPGTLAAVSDKWYELYPDVLFEVFLLKDKIESQYKSEKMVNIIAMIFALAGITIAIVGLLGFSSFILARRKIESAIRKLSGASNWEIIKVLLKEFIIIIAISSVIAFPVAYLISGSWLNNFAFSPGIGFAPFFLAFIITISLCLLLVGIRSWRLATSNLIDSFRSN